MFPLISLAQIDNEKQFDTIISNGFSKNDSLSIQIIYIEQIGCLGRYHGKVKLSTVDDRVQFSHISSNPDTNSDFFWARNENILSIIDEFETTAKKSKRKCGGIIGGTGYKISLSINGTETHFTFCKKEFNGLENLIGKITKLREKK